jgi:hypothetical protein
VFVFWSECGLCSIRKKYGGMNEKLE